MCVPRDCGDVGVEQGQEGVVWVGTGVEMSRLMGKAVAGMNVGAGAEQTVGRSSDAVRVAGRIAGAWMDRGAVVVGFGVGCDFAGADASAAF